MNLGVIPGRLNSTRFPKKIVYSLNGKSVIQHVYDNAKESKLLNQLVIAIDSMETLSHLDKKCETVLTSKGHESGTDRVAEVAGKIKCNIVVNIQGDEPFIDANSLKKLVEELHNSDYVSLMIKISEIQEIENPNNVKVVVNNDNYALYFSRSVIPFRRDSNSDFVDYYKHIGVYGFKKQSLIDFSKTNPSKLELSEKIEAIRIIENGHKIKMIETDFLGVGIDTKEDLGSAISLWLKK